ncbi:unnamed protein product [Sympodiomycopsis kandeliae]
MNQLSRLLLLLYTFTTWAACIAAFPIPLSLLQRETSSHSCNGSPLLCDKRYSDVTYIGAHNSYSNGTSLSSDQNKGVVDQLNDGIRLLQVQGHLYPSLNETGSDNPSEIHLCHTSCLLLDGGTLEAYLSQVKTWIDSHPDDVVTILFTNPDHQAALRWDKGVSYVAGLKDLIYTPPHENMKKNDWPTLNTLLSSNKRLIVFMDYTTDTKRVPYILPEFTHMYENPYDQLNLPFNCSRDRGDNNGTMYLQNQTKDLSTLGVSYPDKDNTPVVNSALGEYGIVDTVQRCQRENGGNQATFVLVDYYDVPQQHGVFEAARVLNGLPAQGGGNNGTSPSNGGARLVGSPCAMSMALTLVAAAAVSLMT